LDTYLDALQNFPDDCDMIEVARSRAFLVKKDIFRNLMWYTMPDSNKQYPLTIEGAKKIKALNKQGIKPEELETVEVVSKKPVEVEPTYADVVGQISLRSLEKTSRKRRDNERGGGNRQRTTDDRQQGGNRPRTADDRTQNRPPQGNRPQGQGGPQQNRGGQNPNQQRPNNPNNPQQGGGNRQGQPQNRPPQGNRPQGGPQQNRGGQNQSRPNNPQQGNRQGQPQNRPPQKPDQGPADKNT
jgi:hypothetical protein